MLCMVLVGFKWIFELQEFSKMPRRSSIGIWMSLWNTWKIIWTVRRYARLQLSYLLFCFLFLELTVISQVCDPDVAVAFSIFLWSSSCRSWSCWMCRSCNDVSTYCSGSEACLAFSFEGNNYFCCNLSDHLTYDVLTCFCFSQ